MLISLGVRFLSVQAIGKNAPTNFAASHIGV